ncbi:uncharacterized protein LOC130134899 [Syzygium oleosum]|uniref:uncharacterized protein LOC130134899 n=1 Tax=Syzygium oleosum TaxID=219896 RepID=UPI0024B9ACAF|nr:uncharacterized protein LOC130134899 [Syzygium oleosum]
MASRYELEVTVSSAKDLKNVNWRHGPTRPYAVVWVDPNDKRSTMVDDQGGTFPFWGQAFVIFLSPGPIDVANLYIDVVHAGPEEDTEPFIGSARVSLRNILDEAGLGVPLGRGLLLKRPSGRPHGRIEVEVCVRETRFRAPPYGVPPATREYAPPVFGIGCAPPQPNPHYTTVPPAGGYANVPYAAYNAPPLQHRYGGEPPAAYGQHRQEEEESNFEGMRTALAVGVGVGVGVGLGAVAVLALAGWLDSSDDRNVDEAA